MITVQILFHRLCIFWLNRRVSRLDRIPFAKQPHGHFARHGRAWDSRQFHRNRLARLKGVTE